MSLNPDVAKRLRKAVKHFWSTRETQAQKQGGVSGSKDAGARSAVTGGAQMNGFINLVRDILCESGLPKAHVYCEKYIEIPGWYRPEKKWDLLVVADKRLLAGIEFKSQVGSFGNNYNNRTEEAIGSAADIWAAYQFGGGFDVRTPVRFLSFRAETRDFLASPSGFASQFSGSAGPGVTVTGTSRNHVLVGGGAVLRF